MRTTHCVRAGWLVGALGACIVLAGTAGAQSLNSERPGSLLMFPKVSCSGQRDTVIQISNTGNMPDTLHCFYLNGAPGRNGRPLCTSTDFLITLTKQQPTHWHVCTGRSPFTAMLVGNAAATSDNIQFLDSAGLSPGNIPPVTDGFEGALVCAESDEEGTPMILNAVKGEATIEGPGPDVSKYNGLAFQGSAAHSNGDDTLDLNGVEYAACPAESRFNFIPAGQNDPVIEEIGNGGVCSVTTTQGCNPDLTKGAGCPGAETCLAGRSSVANNITVLPCKLNFEAGTISNVALNFSGTDEFETVFSGSTTISCWGTFTLAPPIIGAIASRFATVEISAPAGSPFVAVGESFHVDSVGNTAAASVNLITEDSDPSGQIRIY